MRSDYLYDQEADELIAALPYEYRNIVLAAVETGFRIGDLCRAPMWAYDIKENTITLREEKTGKYRTAYVTPRLRVAILGESEKRAGGFALQTYLFERERGVGVSRSTIWRWVTRTWERLHKGSGRKITPHSFRKLYAVNLRQKGRSLEDIRRDLNHERIETTCIYAFADLLHEAEIEKISGRYTLTDKMPSDQI